MTQPVALDTSVAIPLIVATHRDHATVARWRRHRDVVLAGHAVIETYSVLTRLPGDLRHTPTDAAKLIAARFGSPLVLPARDLSSLPAKLARLGIGGGAVYDAIVALAAVEHGVELATRDARARRTYELVGARVVVVA